MAWEIWSDKGSVESTYGRMGFFCNTADESFGPVFLTDTDFDKLQFYKMWDMANFADPRLNEGSLWSQTHRVIHLMDYKDNVDATMTVSQGGKVIFTNSSKDCWDNIDFSPFHPQLEALSESDFDAVIEIIEDANNDMKVLLIADFNEQKGSTHIEDAGIRVSIEWEVINE
jgi:hypothetical protein